MNGHRIHVWRIIVRCDRCGTPILWGCSYTRRHRDPKTGERACIAIDTYQRRHKRRHDCLPVAVVPKHHAPVAAPPPVAIIARAASPYDEVIVAKAFLRIFDGVIAPKSLVRIGRLPLDSGERDD